jgi:hypothetical protein
VPLTFRKSQVLQHQQLANMSRKKSGVFAEKQGSGQRKMTISQAILRFFAIFRFASACPPAICGAGRPAKKIVPKNRP